MTVTNKTDQLHDYVARNVLSGIVQCYAEGDMETVHVLIERMSFETDMPDDMFNTMMLSMSQIAQAKVISSEPSPA